MTSHARAKTMAGSASRSEEISPETFASWTTLIPDAIRTVLYGMRWPPKTGQVAKRESSLGAACWPEVRLVEYSEETQS
jgi:hypothetical protein